MCAPTCMHQPCLAAVAVASSQQIYARTTRHQFTTMLMCADTSSHEPTRQRTRTCHAMTQCSFNLLHAPTRMPPLAGDAEQGEPEGRCGRRTLTTHSIWFWFWLCARMGSRAITRSLFLPPRVDVLKLVANTNSCCCCFMLHVARTCFPSMCGAAAE